MFNFNSFAPNQPAQTLRVPVNKPLQNLSPAFNPIPQSNNWDSNPYFNTVPQQEPKIKEDNNPFHARVLLEHEEEINSTSSDSEETDTMPDVSSTHFKTSSLVKEWDFGQDSEERRKSDTFLSNSPGIVRTGSNPVIGNPKGWMQEAGAKVIAKPSYFSPLNLGGYVQTDKRVYFVTIEGFNTVTNKRFFRIEKICSSLQPKGAPGEGAADVKQFLYVGLWNDNQMGQDDADNIFEPWIYAIPFTQFKMIVTINQSHSYEDAFKFEYLVDLRHFALPTIERRTQSLEVTYTETDSTGQVNNITLHLQVTNEKLLVPQGFRTLSQSAGMKQDQGMEYTVILRQFMIGVPLSRADNPCQSVSPLITQGLQRTNDPSGKRGSAQSLGQERRPSMLENCPQSPMSWSNFTPDMSPSQKKTSQKPPAPEDPALPPGIMTSNANSAAVNFETSNYSAGTSLFKFKGQQRFSMQPVRSQLEDINAKRSNRNQSTDFSIFLGGDKSPLKIVEAYVNAVNNAVPRRESGLSGESTAMSNSLTPARGGLQRQGSGLMPPDLTEMQSQSMSTLNASSFGESMAEIGHFEDDNAMKGNDGVLEEFRIEDYIGKMVEYAKTFDGSKVLQKFVATADKEDLDLVVNELGEKIGELMLDPYANYMLQTLVQNCSAKQRLHLFQKMSPWFISIARDKKGTHSLQALVAQITSPEEISLIKSIVGGSVIDLSLDPRANYVIQKLINTIPIESIQFIYQPLLDNLVQVANNSFGLLVLKQLMIRVEQKESLKQKIVEVTCLHFEKLIQNPYGNYAIQHIMENYSKESFLIMNKILLKIIPYSSQKISSNVIEKCLTVCDYQFRRRVVEEILRNGRLGDLLKNKYGNFVTLQLLATSLPADKQKLMQEIYKCANSFNGTKYKMRWLQFINENPLKINWNTGNREENVYRGGKLTEEELAIQKQGIDIESLEAVKRIWRDMTKEEKSETTNNFQYEKQGGKKNYNKRNDNYTGWVEKYCIDCGREPP